MALTTQSSTPVIPGIDGYHLRHVSIPVVDASQVAEARRSVGERTRALGFSTRTAGEAAIVATEAASEIASFRGRVPPVD